MKPMTKTEILAALAETSDIDKQQVARVLEELHAGDLAGAVAGGHRQARALEQAADRLEGRLGKDAGGAARRVLRPIDPGNEPLRAFAADPDPREAP